MVGAFKGRNLYYLRLKGTVLPLYVFLDEPHIKWMTDITLQRVLSDLRPHIISELTSGTKAGKAKISTIRGDEYQFCYFFRNTGHHSVLLKRRIYTTEPSTGNNKGKRKSRSKDRVSTEARRKSKRKRRERQDMEVDQNVVPSEELMDTTTSSNEEPGASSTNGLPGDPDTPDLPVTPGDDPIVLEPNEEEKPKPRLRLAYEGLRLNSQCLCIVVEPLQKKVNDQHQVPMVADAASEPERQPLFLPEQDHNEAEDQPSAVQGDMMTLSQQLHAMKDYTMGVVDDGEDAEGDVFLGDADDAREF